MIACIVVLGLFVAGYIALLAKTFTTDLPQGAVWLIGTVVYWMGGGFILTHRFL